ncbi:hypothetical protein KSC_079970 [Ktedonobacter sp. SOSP1-52]|uniref:hypothetical protein n=1 Tax=Ktedonobacter sp. SOSP1-52 TaxID=2778366 RepID=UPI0019159A7F|nr:hypothetical protein [Ktedonobacter sp. SOSP1-52]GHO69105.1 hypothetical protein KSC_079970 [Ktedonobacter sp. SOSP1-52]
MHVKRNPEAEFLREEIAKERAAQRRRGLRAMIIFCATLFLCSLTTLRALFTQQPLVVSLFLLLLMGLLIWGIYNGMRNYRTGKLPIATIDIEERRLQERAFLFASAQGQIPRTLGLPSLITKGVLALLCLGWSTDLLVLYGASQGIATFAIIFLFPLGVLLVSVTIRDWLRRRRLLRESADILAERLMLGEITEGQDTE